MIFHIALVSLLLTDVIAIRCGINEFSTTEEEPINSRIIGGANAKKGAWPWLVALAMRSNNRNSTHLESFFKCGGSLITDQHILTAAHCCDDKLYLARLGASYLHSTVSTIDILIASQIVHEGFDVTHGYNDIAIIILKEKVEFTRFIRPICLPNNKFFLRESPDQITSYIAGWGDITYGAGSGADRLQEVHLPLYNHKECQEIYKRYHTNITENNICVGNKGGGKDACQGDSGGPLMARQEVGKVYFVIGIISHGLSCGLQGAPGVYTRVTSYLSWIEKTIFQSLGKKKNTKYLLLNQVSKKKKKYKSFFCNLGSKITHNKRRKCRFFEALFELIKLAKSD